jgi:hypothetical protein
MTKSRHEQEMAEERAFMQRVVDAEYTRAIREGRKQVRAWAVEANHSVFTHPNPGAAAAAAFQDAADQFAPSQIDITEVFSALVSA